MLDARVLAEDNRLILQSGVDLIERLDDRLFCGDPAAAWDGVGKQFRHLIDFYESFLRGIESGSVDYVSRAREPELECSRERSCHRLRSLAERLAGLAERAGDSTIRVKAERPVNDNGDEIWSRSSTARELQFLMSHTIHHFALIKALLATQRFEAPSEFGVAPSTLQHWRETTTVSR